MENDIDSILLGTGIISVVVVPTLFPLGSIVVTRGALDELERCEKMLEEYIIRHAMRDWGDLCDEDKRTNDDACDNGGRLLSSYEICPGIKIWIITEHDRSVTTALLPEEY